MLIVDTDFSNAFPGDIIYADLSRSHFWEIRLEKKPIAMVVYVNWSFNVASAVALEENDEPLTWSDNFLKGRTFTEFREAEQNVENGDIRISEKNTAKIVETGFKAKILTPAAFYCANYHTSGTAPGDWHLPSILELDLLVELLKVFRGENFIFPQKFIQTDFYWSSTECTDCTAYAYCFAKEAYVPKIKMERYRVRPFLLLENRFALVQRILYNQLQKTVRL